MQCPKHNKKFEMFCITCNKTPVCTRCIAHGADHAEHKLIPSAPTGDQQPVVKMPESMVETSSCQHSTDKGITFIRKSNKTCMIKAMGMNEIKWTDPSGQVQNTKTFSTTIHGFTSTLDDRLMLCCYDKIAILEATLSSVRYVSITSPLKPYDIGTTKTGNHVVTVMDDNTYSTTSSSVRGIIVYNKDLKEVARKMKDDKGNNLFVCPAKISISSRGTMAVKNATGEKRSHLVILEPNLKLKFRIIGQGKVVPGNKALPDLTTCDKYDIQDAVFVSNDHMIVSEFHSRSIQLLDDQGMVVRILSKYVDIVWSLCIDDESQLWTGTKKGCVVVYKLQ